jgi:sensory rhodopsin
MWEKLGTVSLICENESWFLSAKPMGGLGLSEEAFVYWTGAAIFGLASLVFAGLAGRRHGSERMFESNIFVSFITTISYVIMALALATAVAENGQPVYWTRWLFYIASCSILTLDIAFIARTPTVKKAEVALFTGLTMFCGFLASIIVTADRWWFFTLSTAAYMGMVYTLFKHPANERANIESIMWFVLLTWSLFPVVWVLAPTGFGVLTILTEAVLYLALDFITKIAFGLYISTRQVLRSNNN